MSGGRDNKRGTPQGGVASPLLSVIYMNRFLKHWRLTGRGEAFHAFAADNGLAHLVQCRNGPSFIYVLIARPRPQTEAVSILAVLATMAS